MKKYIVHSNKLETKVVEIEGEIVSAVEDPSIMWLPAGEYKFKITSPEFLLDKKNHGKNEVFVPVIWHSFCIFNSIDEATEKMKSRK